MVGPTSASWARRLLVRAWECLLFGKAIFSSISGSSQTPGNSGRFEHERASGSTAHPVINASSYHAGRGHRPVTRPFSNETPVTTQRRLLYELSQGAKGGWTPVPVAGTLLQVQIDPAISAYPSAIEVTEFFLGKIEDKLLIQQLTDINDLPVKVQHFDLPWDEIESILGPVPIRRHILRRLVFKNQLKINLMGRDKLFKTTVAGKSQDNFDGTLDQNLIAPTFETDNHLRVAAPDHLLIGEPGHITDFETDPLLGDLT